MFQEPNDYFRVQKRPFLVVLSKTNIPLLLTSYQTLDIPS